MATCKIAEIVTTPFSMLIDNCMYATQGRSADKAFRSAGRFVAGLRMRCTERTIRTLELAVVDLDLRRPAINVPALATAKVSHVTQCPMLVRLALASMSVCYITVRTVRCAAR